MVWISAKRPSKPRPQYFHKLQVYDRTQAAILAIRKGSLNWSQDRNWGGNRPDSGGILLDSPRSSFHRLQSVTH